MQAFLDDFAKTVARDEHVALVLDGAGWHSGKALCVPANITLVPLPPYSPELNPVERVWLYLKQRFLSMRIDPQRLQHNPRRRIKSVEAPVSRDRTLDLSHLIPLDHENPTGQTLGSMV